MPTDEPVRTQANEVNGDKESEYEKVMKTEDSGQEEIQVEHETAVRSSALTPREAPVLRPYLRESSQSNPTHQQVPIRPPKLTPLAPRRSIGSDYVSWVYYAGFCSR